MSNAIANLLIKSSTNFRDSNVQKLGITREPSLRRLSPTKVFIMLESVL